MDAETSPRTAPIFWIQFPTSVGAGYEDTFLTRSPCAVHAGCSPLDFRLEEDSQVAMEPGF